jgi:hypothetical protein
LTKNIIFNLLGLLVLLAAGACGTDKASAEKVTATGQYYNVIGFVEEQVAWLEKEKPGALKSVSENQAETETKQVQNLDWSAELETFRELDINKPAFRNAYAVTRQQDPATGRTTITYRKKPDYDGNVQYLIVTLNPAGQVVSLRGLQQSQNVLLRSQRELELRCHTKNGVARVISYSIKGLQKPLIFDALYYRIFTKIG